MHGTERQPPGTPAWWPPTTWPFHALLLLMSLAYTALIVATVSPHANDFEFFRRAAQTMLETGDPYARRAGYLYPPLLAYLLQPFGWLSPATAQFVWLGLNIGFCACVPLLALRCVGGTVARSWSLVVLGFVLFPALRLTLQLGQVSGLLTVLLLLCVGQSARRPWLAGLCLALAGGVKLYPLFLGLYFLRVPPRAVAWWSALAGVALGIATLALYGAQPYLSYMTQTIPRETLPFAAEFNISLVGFWSRLLVASPYTIPVADLPPLAYLLIVLSSTAVVAVCLIVTRRTVDALERQLQMSLWLCAMLLLSPLNGYYNLILLVLPFLAMLRFLEQRPDPGALRVLLLATALLFVPPTWSTQVAPLAHLTRASWGVLLLAPSFYGLLAYVLLLAALVRRPHRGG